MARSLLIGSQTGVWREWLKENREGRDVLCLDPADADFGFPGRYSIDREGKAYAWSFAGSLSAMRSPHALMAALPMLLSQASENLLVELFPYRPSPLRLQMARLVAHFIKPDEILVDRRCHLEKSGWPRSLEEMELMEAPPALVQAGHRKARWLQMLEQCEPHEIDLRHVAVDGLRLGSGVPVPMENLRKFGFQEPLHAETAGSSLLVVSDAPVEDVEISRALDSTHTSKAHVISSATYSGLLCAFTRRSGEDFGMGRIAKIAFPEMTATIQCTAVPPAPVNTVKVGGLRIDGEGRELGELRPWES